MTATMTVPTEKLAAQVTDLLLAGGTMGDVYDYSEQDYEVLYALGHSMYTQGRYVDAVKAFGFLVIHNHLERRFVNAYASALQMIKSYEDALSFYSLASVMDIEDPAPTFHSGECLLALGRIDDARQALTFTIRDCKKPAHANLKERAEALLKLLDGQQGSVQ